MGLAMIFRWSYSNNSIMKNVILSLLFFAFSLSGVAQNGNIIIPSGHDGAVRIIMIDNQSKYFYTADEWKVIMWDFNTAKQLYTFPISNKATTQHFGSEVHNLRDLIVSADGKTLAFTTSEDELVIYSTESGKKINSIHGVVSRINFSKDGKTIYDFVRGPEGGDVQPGTNGRMIRTINVQSGAIIDYWHKKDMNIWGSFIQYFFPIEAGKVINFDNQGYTVLDLDEKKEIIKSNVHEQLKDNYKIDTEGFNRHYFQVAFGSGLFSFQTHKVKGSLGFLVWDVYDNKEFAFLPLDKNYKVHDSYVKGRFLFANKSSRYDKQEAGILEQGNKIAKKVNITGSNEIKVAALSKNGNTIIYCGEDQKLYKYDLEKPIQNPLPAVAANVALASVTRKNDDLIFNSISRKYDKGETINFESENVNYIVDLMRMAVKTADTLPIKQAKSLYTVRLNKDSFLLAYSNPNDERFMYNVRTRKTVSFQNKSLPITLNSTWRSFPKIPAIFAAKGSGNFFITEDGTDNKGRDIAGLVKYNLNTKQSTRIFSTGYFQGDEWEQRVNDMNNRARVENALVMDQENNLLASAEFYYKGTVRVMDLNTGKTLGQRSFVYDSAAYAKGNTTGASGIIQEGIQNYPYYITQVKKINDHTARVLAMEKIFEIDLNGGAGKEIQIIQPQYFSQKRNIKLFANNKMETVISTYQTGNRLVAETIYGPYQYKLTHLASPINSIEFSKNDSILYTVNENKSFSAYNAITGFYYGTLYTFENSSDWVFMGVDGRFDGTKDGMNRLYYLNGREVVSIDKVFEKYYTPNLFQRLTAGEGFEPVPDIDFKPKPRTNILYAEVKRNLEVEDDKPTYSNTSGIAEITVNATAPEDKVDEIRLFHNGKAVNLATRGLFVTEADGTDSKKYTINLLPGANNFRAIVLNSQRTESEPDEILVNYQSGNAPAPKPGGSTNGTVIDAVDKNATMHLVVVGVNAYKGKIKPLGYAVPDATAFREELEKDARSVISNVKSYFITDAQADKTGIVNAFNDIKKNAKPQDVFVFYYAGHGYIHPGNKEFYLVSADVEDGNESLLKNGVAAKELQSFAVDIAAQKQVFILDACQSAGAFEQMLKHDGEQQKALAVVSRSTGTHWMAASGSTETAKEFGELGHGAFTYTLLQALKGQAAANKMITVNGLKNFLQVQVPELIKKYGGGAQYPASYGFGNDFPVEVVK